MGNILMLCGIILFVITIGLAFYYKKRPLIYEKNNEIQPSKGKTEFIKKGYATEDILDKKDTEMYHDDHLMTTEVLQKETELLDSRSQTKPMESLLGDTEILNSVRKDEYHD
ncbi:hypothetical protein [Holdemania massiliensis]|uniref:hypothetical protein n=1 Tax=Holdemania massiliensis TaxID=1468449 RepID=UPI0002ECC96D|nr:hypothetical protein [Holdemania massiliensis]